MLFTILLLMVVAFLSPACARQAGSAKVLFARQWDGEFRRRPTEEGDTLSIGAAFSDGTRIFLYDQAAGQVAVVNGRGQVARKVSLQSIGRGTYFGDDFVVLDTLLLFINSVDRRIEVFDSESGNHLRSEPLPREPFESQRQRSRRLANRIFLSGTQVLVGNGHLLVALNRSLRKSATDNSTLTAPENERFALVTRERTVTAQGSSLRDSATGRKRAFPPTHYPVSGKRILAYRGALYALVLSPGGISISEVR